LFFFLSKKNLVLLNVNLDRAKGNVHRRRYEVMENDNDVDEMVDGSGFLWFSCSCSINDNWVIIDNEY
jgi:hypothetical protein